MLAASELNPDGLPLAPNRYMNLPSPTPAPLPLLPPLYLSHGSPMIALQPGATGAFFQQLGRVAREGFARPRAVLAVSAHTALRNRRDADALALSADRHMAIHDFGGFDPRLNTLRYDTPGDPDCAREAIELMQRAGMRGQLLPRGGLDHGIWTALMHLHPAADWPIVPLAWGQDASPADLEALGKALQPLVDQGVLLLATGSITHNLARVFQGGAGRGAPDASAREIPESRAFRQWWADRASAGNAQDLRDWERLAPHAHDMHPSAEHLLPWFVASGAAPGPAVRLHEGVTFGCLGMDAYAFGPQANALLQALDAPGQAG